MSRIAFTTGGVLLVAALLWLVVGVPTLVKYPSNLEVSPRYTGTFSAFVDPATYAPRPEPTRQPMTIDRHIDVIDSTSSRAVVRETIVQRAGTLLDTTQRNQYVIDRRTLRNVADDRSWAFEPTNIVDRSRSYRLNLPFGTKEAGRYRIWKNETAQTYVMQAPTSGPAETTRAGLTLQNHHSVATDVPMSDAYLEELRKVLPLPPSMTLDQLKPQLRAAGFDVDTLLPALLPKLTPNEARMLAAWGAKPIPLRYTMSFDAHTAVEPTTGAEVAFGATESIGVRLNSPDLPALRALLDKYRQVPEAAAAATAVDRLATRSIELFASRYAQTPASVADVASTVKHLRRQVVLATRWIPLGLALLAGVALLIGGWEWPRPRRPRRARAPVRRPVEA